MSDSDSDSEQREYYVCPTCFQELGLAVRIDKKNHQLLLTLACGEGKGCFESTHKVDINSLYTLLPHDTFGKRKKWTEKKQNAALLDAWKKDAEAERQSKKRQRQETLNLPPEELPATLPTTE
jgi:uncharacterized protein YjbK